MSTRVRRTVASTPERTAMETWEKISSLVAPDPKSSARAELAKVAGVAASSISSNGPKDDPIIVYDGGPRVHVYCIYSDDAVTGENAEEEPLSKCPMEGDGWKMSIPVPKEDLDWSKRKLKSCSSRVTVRAIGEDLEEEKKKSEAARAEAIIDVKEFLKP